MTNLGATCEIPEDEEEEDGTGVFLTEAEDEEGWPGL